MSAPVTSAELLEGALGHAARGWRVMPLYAAEDCQAGRCPAAAACESPGKHPRLREWPTVATTDAGTLKEWWRRWPAANVGVATGEVSGIIVLDVDPRHGGDESLARLQSEHGALPRTVRQQTGGGGEHIFLQHPGFRVGNQQGKATIAPGLDVRGDGGQIVVEPSGHASGRRYVFDVAHHPDDTPVAVAPAWVLARLQERTGADGGNGRGGAPPVPEVIPEGERNGTLLSLAGSMRRRGMTEDEIVAALLAVNASRCVPPLDETEVRAIAASVGRYAPAAPSAGTAEREPALRLLTWRDMTSLPPEPPRYHWDPWVTVAAVALIAGAGESLKSWLALMIGIASAAGRPVLVGEDAPLPPGPVLYITAENAIAEEQRRASLIKAGLGLPDDLPLTFLPAESLFFRNREDYQAVLRVVNDLRPATIVIDSAIAVSGLKDENDNAAVREFMKSRIAPLARRYHATVYVIVHSPKPPVKPGLRFTDEHVARGASDWRNAADVVLYLRREPALGEYAVVLKPAKVRVGRRPAAVWFQLEESAPGTALRLVLGGSYDDDSGQAAESATGIRKAVLAALEILTRARPGGAYLTGLLEQLGEAGVSKSTARRALDAMRGRTEWAYGSLKGKQQAITTEDAIGRRVFLTLNSSAQPPDFARGSEHIDSVADDDPFA